MSIIKKKNTFKTIFGNEGELENGVQCNLCIVLFFLTTMNKVYIYSDPFGGQISGFCILLNLWRHRQTHVPYGVKVTLFFFLPAI